jgi:hypothetical protein
MLVLKSLQTRSRDGIFALPRTPTKVYIIRTISIYYEGYLRFTVVRYILFLQ